MRRSRAALTGMLAVCVPATAESQRARFPAESVHVSVVVEPAGTARVRVFAHLTTPVRTADFSYLAHSCNPVTGIAVARGTVTVGVSIDTTPPWVAVHDTTELPDGTAASTYEITYQTDLGDLESSIPLLVPAAALDASPVRARPAVIIDVRFPEDDAEATVLSPRLTKADGRWSTRLAVIPSSIRVRAGQGGRSDGCEGATPRLIPGDSGRFRLIFASLMGTMILWVPLYFWWAHRQKDAA